VTGQIDNENDGSDWYSSAPQMAEKEKVDREESVMIEFAIFRLLFVSLAALFVFATIFLKKS
jgi:hypothetical protein